MVSSNMPTRAGSVPRRNQAWENLESKHHARTQAEMVESVMLERNKGRLGVRTEDLGNKENDRTPASKLNEMKYEDLQAFFNTVLRKHKIIKRLEAYKDDRLLEDDFFEKRVRIENYNLSANVYKSIIHLSDKLALEFPKKDVAGLDVDYDGNFCIYYWLPEEEEANKEPSESVVKSGRKNKKKEEVEVKEEKPVEVKEEYLAKPVIRLHYMLH